MTLPYDIARCFGTTDELCKKCRRREPGDPVVQWYVNPAIEGGQCENFIEIKCEAKHEYTDR